MITLACGAILHIVRRFIRKIEQALRLSLEAHHHGAAVTYDSDAATGARVPRAWTAWPLPPPPASSAGRLCSCRCPSPRHRRTQLSSSHTSVGAAVLGRMPPARLRRSFKPGSQLKVFYTGGSARLSRDGQLLACACGDDISIVSAAGGAVQRTLKGDTEPVTALCFRWGPPALKGRFCVPLTHRSAHIRTGMGTLG